MTLTIHDAPMPERAAGVGHELHGDRLTRIRRPRRRRARSRRRPGWRGASAARPSIARRALRGQAREPRPPPRRQPVLPQRHASVRRPGTPRGPISPAMPLRAVQAARPVADDGGPHAGARVQQHHGPRASPGPLDQLGAPRPPGSRCGRRCWSRSCARDHLGDRHVAPAQVGGVLAHRSRLEVHQRPARTTPTDERRVRTMPAPSISASSASAISVSAAPEGVLRRAATGGARAPGRRHPPAPGSCSGRRRGRPTTNSERALNSSSTPGRHAPAPTARSPARGRAPRRGRSSTIWDTVGLASDTTLASPAREIGPLALDRVQDEGPVDRADGPGVRGPRPVWAGAPSSLFRSVALPNCNA